MAILGLGRRLAYGGLVLFDAQPIQVPAEKENRIMFCIVGSYGTAAAFSSKKNAFTCVLHFPMYASLNLIKCTKTGKIVEFMIMCLVRLTENCNIYGIPCDIWLQFYGR